jgi:hypothetical protein
MSTSAQRDTSAASVSTLQRPSVPEASYEAFFKVVARLDTVLDEEMACLRKAAPVDLSELTRRKRQGYYELDRLMRSFEGTIPSQDIIERLATFRVKLDDNGNALKLHLQAAQDITATIVKVMQDSESDGTYSRAFLRDFDLP